MHGCARWVVLVVLGLWRLEARAGGELVAADFEDPNFLLSEDPRGVWQALDAYAAVDAGHSPAAAHRGDAGLVLVDQSGLSGPGDMTGLYSQHWAVADTLSLRFWVRLAASNALGSAVVGQLLSDSPNARSLCDVVVDFRTNQLVIEGDDGAGRWTSSPTQVSLD